MTNLPAPSEAPGRELLFAHASAAQQALEPSEPSAVSPVSVAPDEVATGKKISAKKRVRPQVSWPVALRAVRGWLEPCIMLRRYWNGWSLLPPPPELQILLRWLEQGHAISLYSSA